MPNMRTYNRSFSGGEISPEMYGRIDDAKFQAGAAMMRNFIATPTGAARNRAGFAYVNGTKGNGAARLIPFTYSLDQTMVIELGNQYARFHTQGETLEQPSGIAAYVGSTVVTFNIGASEVNWTAHGFNTGDRVFFQLVGGGALLPTPLTVVTIYYVIRVDANTLQLAATSGGSAIALSGSQGATIDGWKYYGVADLVASGGANYYCTTAFAVNAPPNTTYWYALPADGTYEIPTPYLAADLLSIHFAQSADVMTLVHTNYAPAELSRLSATAWALSAIAFGPPLATPANVAVAASPGYLAKISSVTTGGTGFTGQALFTTQSSHTLALGDGVYVANLTFTPSSGPPQVLDGFYMVDAVPVDGSGNLINNELYLMDYSGNNILFQSPGTYSSGATIQFGTKIFRAFLY